MQAPGVVSRWKQALVAALFTGPVLLSAATTIASARSGPLGLQPMVRDSFRLGVEWLWFFAVCFAMVHLVRVAAKVKVERLSGAVVNAGLAFVGATGVSIVIAFNDSAAFAANLGKGRASPVQFVTHFAAPGTWLADQLFDATVGAPDASAVLKDLLAEDSKVGTSVRDVDGRSVLLTIDRSLNSSLVRLDARGEVDPSFFALGALLHVPGDVVPVSADVVLVDTYDGLMRVERGHGVAPVVLPDATRAALPNTKRPLAFLRARRAVRGALWLAFSYDIVGPEHAGIPLAARISESFEVQGLVRQDQLPAALTRQGDAYESHAISPIALSADGRIAFSIRRGELGRVVVLSPDAKLMRVATLDALAHGTFFGARFVGEDQLVVLWLDWQEQEPRVVAERLDLATGAVTEVKSDVSQKGLVAAGLGAFADGSVLLDAAGGPVFRGVDFGALPERDARLRAGKCGSTLMESHPVVELDDGVLVQTGRRFFAGAAGSTPIAPFLKVRVDGSVDETWNPRLIDRLCR